MRRPLLCILGIHRPVICFWIIGRHQPWHECERCAYYWWSHREHRRSKKDRLKITLLINSLHFPRIEKFGHGR